MNLREKFRADLVPQPRRPHFPIPAGLTPELQADTCRHVRDVLTREESRGTLQLRLTTSLVALASDLGLLVSRGIAACQHPHITNANCLQREALVKECLG